MLIVPALDIRFADRLLHTGCIQFDIADAELLRRHKLIFMLLVVVANLFRRHALLRRQGVDVDRHFTHQTLLSDQRCQRVRFVTQHKIRTGNGLDQLLSGQLLTQRFRILIGGEAQVADRAKVFRIIKLTVGLESGLGEDCLFDLVIANRQANIFRVLVEQLLINQLRQRLLADLLHVAFIACQLRELLAQHLLLTRTFAAKSTFKLSTADFLTVHFRGVITVTARQITAYAGEDEGKDDQTQ